MREIGSEFAWEPAGKANHPLPTDVTFTLSGRTALALALEDAGVCSGTALLPDWCCSSMIEPFRAAGLAVEFYPAHIRKVPFIPERCTVLLRCGYFGYSQARTWDTPQKFRRRGGVVIEDITHSLFSLTPSHSGSDYLVASLRKWGPLLCGGLCAKPGGRLKERTLTPPSAEFLTLRRQAMELRAQYLRDGDPAKKILSRELLAKSSTWLSANWRNTAMDDLSLDLLTHWDTETLVRTRRKNARFLHEALSGSKRAHPLYPLRDGDCPLFVPVEVPEGRRDELQRQLIDRGIYCPIHWPRPEGCSGKIYDTELSLVCDQRYSTDDMARIIEVIET